MSVILVLAASIAIALVCPCASQVAVAKVAVADLVAAEVDPKDCPEGQEYNDCRLPCQSTCQDLLKPTDCDCAPGCYCPEGLFFDANKKCVKKEECGTCTDAKGNVYQNGDVVSAGREGQTCVCVDGVLDCGAPGCHCSGQGDPHYTTCDGTYFDYQGQCSYYLTQGPGYSVEAKNYMCGTTVACVQDVTIKLGSSFTAKLTVNPLELFINGNLYPTANLPYISTNPQFKVENVGSYSLVATLPNGIIVTVNWGFDVFIPDNMTGNTNGLCGKYNNVASDDLVLANGQSTNDPILFGNSWNTVSTCNSFPTSGRKKRQLTKATNQKEAQALCKIMASEPFSKCNAVVSMEPYLKNCITDTTSASGDANVFACNSLAAYATACYIKTRNVVVWRDLAPACAMKCPDGLNYETCHRGCTTCKDLSTPCSNSCAEGCFCPRGFYLDKNMRCVPENKCPCYVGEKELPPGSTYTFPGQKLPKTCVSGTWV